MGPEHQDSRTYNYPWKPDASNTLLPRKMTPCPTCFLFPPDSRPVLCFHLTCFWVYVTCLHPAARESGKVSVQLLPCVGRIHTEKDFQKILCSHKTIHLHNIYGQFYPTRPTVSHTGGTNRERETGTFHGTGMPKHLALLNLYTCSNPVVWPLLFFHILFLFPSLIRCSSKASASVTAMEW